MGYARRKWSFVSILSEAMYRSLKKTQATSQHLNAIVSGTPDAVFIKDLEGRYQLFNESAGSQRI
jgi:hypothetical protein